jgi:hypothetical protein
MLMEGRSGNGGLHRNGFAYSDDVAAPKRVAPRRTAGAIAEDLVQARKVGGLWRTREADLFATIDFLSLSGASATEDPLARARDLLASHVRRECEKAKKQSRQGKTAFAAVSSLQTLLLRPETSNRKAQLVRQDAVQAAKHSVSADAVRHREDQIINRIAEAVVADLEKRRSDEPQSVEAAIHHLVPIASDIRQQLHDGLCLTYMNATPADPRERKVVDGYYQQMVGKLGDLLLASIQLAKVGLKATDMTNDDYWFVHRARNINAFLFDDEDDRRFMLDFIRKDETEGWEERTANLRATARGVELYSRWIEWANSCYPTCAFERTVDIMRMCSPHALVTLLYEIEIKYTELGFSELRVTGNQPILHHRFAYTGADRQNLAEWA